MARPIKPGTTKSRLAEEKRVAVLMRQWRRRMALLIAGTIVAGVILALFVTGVLPPPRKLTPTDLEILRGYEEIRSSLANDDLIEARKAASHLSEKCEDRPFVLSPVSKLIKAPSLEESRVAFKALSVEAVKLAASQPGYFILECRKTLGCPEPCMKCPMDEFGKWVQVFEKAENPFMGKQHIRCGTVAR